MQLYSFKWQCNFIPSTKATTKPWAKNVFCDDSNYPTGTENYVAKGLLICGHEPWVLTRKAGIHSMNKVSYFTSLIVATNLVR